MKKDLNQEKVITDRADALPDLQNNNVASAGVRCYFRDIEKHLLRHIAEYESAARVAFSKRSPPRLRPGQSILAAATAHPRKLVEPAVVGCIAWFTNTRVLAALARTNCALIVQKEDFLRPDYQGATKADLRRVYETIGGVTRKDFDFEGTRIARMNTNGDDADIGVRCVGMSSGRNRVVPRMHNKFLVFGRQEYSRPKGCAPIFVPEAVWTGSYNITNNATRSFENAVFLRDPIIAHAYLQEFSEIAALSEPLNWEHEYVDPEWREGT